MVRITGKSEFLDFGLPKLYCITKESRFLQTQEIMGIKIFHYSGGLNFASKAAFRNLLYRKLGFDPHSLLRKRLRLEESRSSTVESEELMLKCIVLDFSALTYVDPAGVDVLRQLKNVYAQLDIEMYIAACSGKIIIVVVCTINV